MSSIGYPDFFKPRDWLAGLTTVQQLWSTNIFAGGPGTIFTVPAGKTLVLTRLLVQTAIVANAVGPGSFRVSVTASRGIDGASAAAEIQAMWLICPTGGGAFESIDLPHPMLITAPVGNTNLIQQAGTNNINLANWDGVTLGYGALLN